MLTIYNNHQAQLQNLVMSVFYIHYDTAGTALLSHALEMIVPGEGNGGRREGESVRILLFLHLV